jgi:hypothetical protein
MVQLCNELLYISCIIETYLWEQQGFIIVVVVVVLGGGTL